MTGIFSTFQGIIDAAGDPQRFHAMAVHLPVGAAFIGLLLTLLLAMTMGKSGGLRWATIAVYALGITTAFLAVNSGEAAADRLAEHVTLKAPVSDLLHEHEEMAEKLWMFLALTGVLVLLTSIKPFLIRVPALLAAIVLALASLAWVAVTAHHGGTMVYAHGVGVPRGAYNLTPQPVEPRSLLPDGPSIQETIDKVEAAIKQQIPGHDAATPAPEAPPDSPPSGKP